MPASARITRRLQGPLTIYSAAERKPELLAGLDAGDLELDLAEVDELDSAGLQLLVLAKLEAERQGHRLSLCNHSAAVIEVLELSGLSAFFGDPILLSTRAQGGHPA